ncbi:hypothetical protein SAMN05216550_10447 [Paraburkholderia tropica]|uniref:Uncharacterized protein n=1 Tax=Paraburkholderia tropica TaxID=92647 RepID=A0AAQ1JT16_9BURK|nr:hypothetical protein SAMN05216550_10447 [Paraburkholderia tropica]
MQALLMRLCGEKWGAKKRRLKTYARQNEVARAKGLA